MQTKFTNLMSVITEDREGLEFTYRIYMFKTEHKTHDELTEAVKAACTEYIKTDTGRKIYEHNGHSFNFGDLSLYVPKSICEKHGFVLQDDFDCEWHDFNEQLVTEE